MAEREYIDDSISAETSKTFSENHNIFCFDAVFVCFYVVKATFIFVVT